MSSSEDETVAYKCNNCSSYFLKERIYMSHKRQCHSTWVRGTRIREWIEAVGESSIPNVIPTVQDSKRMSQPHVVKKMRLDNNVGFAHPDTMGDIGKKLLKDKEDCDVFFIVGPESERIGAHKLILKNRSSVFQIMFSSRWNEGSAQEGHEIVLEEEEPSVFHLFLEYVYADMFSATAVQAVELLYLAEFYDVQPLVELCQEALTKNFTPEEVIQVFLTARKYNLSHAWSNSALRIARYFVLLGNSPALEKFDESALILFLNRDDLCVEESQLFVFLLKWADKQIENSVLNPKPERKDMLRNLIPLVRFPIMTPKEFASVVVPTNILPEQTMLRLFTYLNSDQENRIEIGKNLPYAKTRRRGMPFRVDLYKGSVRPGTGSYQETLLKKFSNARDILTFKFLGSRRTAEKGHSFRIISLVLQGALYGQAIFKNSAEVGEIFPIKVGISLCLARTSRQKIHRMFPVNDEFTVNVGKDEVEVQLDKPWEILSDKLYKITLRFLSDVYTVPKTFDDGSGERKKCRDESLDLFTSTSLQDEAQHESPGGFFELSQVSMGSGTVDPISGVSLRQAYNLLPDPKVVSTGLHLLRALKIEYA